MKQELSKLKHPVTLKVFINEKDEEKTNKTLSTLQMFKENSNEKLNFEIIRINKRSSTMQQYQIDSVPAILFINKEGEELIRYLMAPQGSEVKPFIKALQIFSGMDNYYEKKLREYLNKINPSKVRVMVSKSCAYCPELVNIISQFALATSGKVKAEIIDIIENPDIGNQYNIETVPYTIINDGSPIVGLINPNELLQELIINII
jgi:thioredoxin-like negative regulator of GroEL